MPLDTDLYMSGSWIMEVAFAGNRKGICGTLQARLYVVLAGSQKEGHT